MESCLTLAPHQTNTMEDVMPVGQCPICFGEQFTCLSEIKSSAWDLKMRMDLRRIWLGLPLGQCQGCGHQMLLNDFAPEMIESLYVPVVPEFNPNSCARHPEIHEDVLDFVAPFLTVAEPTVVDFGCGDLTLLRRMAGKLDAVRPHCIGIDFAKRRVDFSCMPPNTTWIEADLQKLEETDALTGVKFDYGFMTHVLEHIPNPRKVLRAMRSMMKDSAFLYVEVPANELLGECDLDCADLIVPQHVHYFTLEHLGILAFNCGFSVLKQRACVTKGTPRAQVVLTKRAFEHEPSSVVAGQHHIENTLQAVGERIIHLIEGSSPVVLWGVGADLETLCYCNPGLRQKVREQGAILVDSFLHGKRWEGCLIEEPSMLNEGKNYKVVITPRALHLRQDIFDVAVGLGVSKEHIVDLYQELSC